MLTILGRYIAKTIVIATLLVLLVITGLTTLMMLLAELKHLGEGDYGILQAVLYVLLRLPNEIYNFSPILILLGSIIGLSILSSHRELAVMRTAGFSVKRIMLNVLAVTCLLVVAMCALGEGVAPKLSYQAEISKENAKNAGQAVVTAAGIWLHVQNNFIHVQHVVGRELLEGVTRYEFNEQHQLQAAYYAKTLTYVNHQWQMNDMVKTTFSATGTESQTVQTALWDLKFNPNLLSMGLVSANEMSLPRLAKFARYLEKNGLQASEYRYEFWQRILQPWVSVVMVFLAVPFVLGTLSTSTMGWRLMAGVLVGFAFFILNALLAQLSIVYQLPPAIAAFSPLLIFTLLGMLLWRRLVVR